MLLEGRKTQSQLERKKAKQNKKRNAPFDFQRDLLQRARIYFKNKAVKGVDLNASFNSQE